MFYLSIISSDTVTSTELSTIEDATEIPMTTVAFSEDELTTVAEEFITSESKMLAFA